MARVPTSHKGTPHNLIDNPPAHTAERPGGYCYPRGMIEIAKLSNGAVAVYRPYEDTVLILTISEADELARALKEVTK